MQEKRKHKRVKLLPFISSKVYGAIMNDKNMKVDVNRFIDKSAFMVFDKKTDKIIGNLVDISAKGIMVVSEVPIKKNTVCQLRMKFIQKIILEAKCVWIRDIGGNHYISGLEFIKINPKDIDIIEQSINQFLAED